MAKEQKQDIVVGLDLGTTKVCTIIGEQDDDGQVHIIGVGTTPSTGLKKGSVVTSEVIDVKEGGIDVKIVGTEYVSFIKRSELARDRSEQRPDRFAVGQKVDARVIQFDRRTHKVQVSIKALEVAEEKEAIAQYGSSDSGATLGDILGTALKRKGEEDAKE